MEFGEDGILRTIQANGSCSAQLLMEKLVTSVQSFSSREQIDDLTLVVARGR
jgi:serine phosphatase RsbU (regulator of sigma subunit)